MARRGYSAVPEILGGATSVPLPLQQFNDDPVGVADVARVATLTGSVAHADVSTLDRCVGREELVPCLLDVIAFEANLLHLRHTRLRWPAIDCTTHILNKFDMVPMTVEMCHHERSIGDAGDRLLPVSLTR